MERFLFSVDKISMWMGRAFGWCIMVLTFATCLFRRCCSSVMSTIRPGPSSR